MTPDDGGYVALAVVAPGRHGTGIGREISRRIEAEPRRRGIGRVRSRASHVAGELFEGQGRHVVREQVVERGDAVLTGFEMEKTLCTGL